MRKLALILLLGFATACTPSQRQAWLDWFDVDPQAAVAFTAQGCGGLGCAVDSADPQHDGDEGSDTAGIYWPWQELAECESGGNWSTNTGNGYYGGLQFSLTSWSAAGGSGLPSDASASEQIARGEILQDMQGWGAWPTCARIVGLL